MRKLPTWDENLMGMAENAAQKSKDPRTQVGACIVSPFKSVLSTGFNGIPAGVEDKEERLVPPEKYLWVAHAEENAIYNAARMGSRLDGGTIYVTHHPCARCAGAIIGAGLKRVVVGPGKTNMPEPEFEIAAVKFFEAGVEVNHYGKP